MHGVTTFDLASYPDCSLGTRHKRKARASVLHLQLDEKCCGWCALQPRPRRARKTGLPGYSSICFKARINKVYIDLCHSSQLIFACFCVLLFCRSASSTLLASCPMRPRVLSSVRSSVEMCVGSLPTNYIEKQLYSVSCSHLFFYLLNFLCI